MNALEADLQEHMYELIFNPRFVLLFYLSGVCGCVEYMYKVKTYGEAPLPGWPSVSALVVCVSEVVMSSDVVVRWMLYVVVLCVSGACGCVHLSASGCLVCVPDFNELNRIETLGETR